MGQPQAGGMGSSIDQDFESSFGRGTAFTGTESAEVGRSIGSLCGRASSSLMGLNARSIDCKSQPARKEHIFIYLFVCWSNEIFWLIDYFRVEINSEPKTRSG